MDCAFNTEEDGQTFVFKLTFPCGSEGFYMSSIHAASSFSGPPISLTLYIATHLLLESKTWARFQKLIIKSHFNTSAFDVFNNCTCQYSQIGVISSE